MCMERKVIETNAIIVYDRDVYASELNATIPENFEGDIVVHGRVLYDEELPDIRYTLYDLAEN